MYDITHANPELFAALAAAQGEIENANKNAANPHFRSKYADLAEVLNTIRPVFAKHGLSLIQSPGFDGSMASVTTVLAHQSGGYMTSTASCVPAKADAQGIGSATTYLRRYGAAAVAGIAQEDDDGNAAAHNKPHAVVTAEQAATLRDMLEATSSNEEKFSAQFGVQSVEAIPAAKYEIAVARIEQKRQRQAA